MRFRRAAILVLACILPFAAGCRKPAPRATPQPTGIVEGTIAFTGNLPSPAAVITTPIVNMSPDPLCANLQQSLQWRTEDHAHPRALPPVFLWISTPIQTSSTIEGQNFKTTPQQAVLTQYYCRFHPQLLGVMPGQPIDFTSSDPIPAHFLVTPQVSGNPSLHLTSMPRKPGQIHSFPHPELMIPVTEAGRPWMHAYINVVPTPYFTVSGPQGHFRLPNLPPGTYTLSAIRPGFPAQAQSITIQANTSTQISFTFAATAAGTAPPASPSQK